VTVDIGTGDGKAVLRWARAEPRRLVIGVDANAAGMRPSARRASHVPNAAFAVAAAEALPPDLDGIADRVTVQFPWGSLLRGILSADGAVLANLARVAAPGATLTILWSLVARDRGTIGPVPARPDETGYTAAGFDIRELGVASVSDVGSCGSTWAKRLRAGADRPVTLLRAVRR